MNQMYFDEHVSTSTAMNLFCRAYPAIRGFASLAKQIYKGGNPHFEVHQGTSSTSGYVFAHSITILMNQMYIDVLLVVYGVFFAMGKLDEEPMYFSMGIELHRSTFGSSLYGFRRENAQMFKGQEAGMNKLELEENRRALRLRWVVFWLFALGALCLGVYFGLFIGFKVFGGA